MDQMPGGGGNRIPPLIQLETGHAPIIIVAGDKVAKYAAQIVQQLLAASAVTETTQPPHPYEASSSDDDIPPSGAAPLHRTSTRGQEPSGNDGPPSASFQVEREKAVFEKQLAQLKKQLEAEVILRREAQREADAARGEARAALLEYEQTISLLSDRSKIVVRKNQALREDNQRLMRALLLAQQGKSSGDPDEQPPREPSPNGGHVFPQADRHTPSPQERKRAAPLRRIHGQPSPRKLEVPTKMERGSLNRDHKH